MAEDQKPEAQDPKEIWVKPAVTFLKSIGLFFDVATLMVRLLVNTLLYDSPLGKRESTEERAASK